VNKKKQKNFDNFWPVALQRPWRRGAKVFWFSFSKKNSLFLFTFLIFGRLGSYEKEAKRLLLRFARVGHRPESHQKIKVFFASFLFTKKKTRLQT
jgi:hypothetical protein